MSKFIGSTSITLPPLDFYIYTRIIEIYTQHPDLGVKRLITSEN